MALMKKSMNKNDLTAHEIACCVLDFIDRMGDHCEQDTAERILNEFIHSVEAPLKHYVLPRYGLKDWAVLDEARELIDEIKQVEAQG